MLCDYCMSHAEYVWHTKHKGQSRSACTVHWHMLHKLKHKNGGRITDMQGNTHHHHHITGGV